MDPGHILRKEISLFKKLTGTTCTWISFSTLLLSIILHIVAFSTNGWLTVSQQLVGGQSVSRDVGLWQECHEDLGCRYFGVAELNREYLSPVLKFMSKSESINHKNVLLLNDG